jgi:hypothetical protein
MFAGGSLALNTGSTLSGDGLFQIAGATVSVNDALMVSNLELDAGLLTGNAALTITGTFNWTGGTMSGAGSTTLAAGATLNLSGNTDKTLDGRTLLLGGTTNWTDGGNFNLANGAAITNQSSGVFNILNDQNLSGNGSFSNAGTINKSAGAGTMTAVAAGIALSNDGGTVNVQSGVLSFAGDYTQNGGATVLNAGATLAAGGTVNLLGGTLSGTGTVNGNLINGGQINPGGIGVAGILTINGNYTQTATGVLNIDIGGTAAGSGYDQLVISGSATLAGTLNVNLINGFTPTTGATFPILTCGASRTGTFGTVSLGPRFRVPPTYDAMDVTLEAL